ncbi:leucine-rich repeat domain-containing protein [Candidatus Halobeggiatoa sp. HSG11]|nr:leucine-rich repeat domain-containing protein [Candidatus Halobeggiatoa sp. HSG11]
MKTIKYLILVVLLITISITTVHAATNCSFPAQTEIPETECDALIAIYNNTAGASWTDSPGNGWNQNDSPCSWSGIVCSGGNVIEVSKLSNNLTGVLPDLSALTNLEHLGFFDNNLTGDIPNLSGLNNLRNLYLEYNDLTGTIPAQLGNLLNLEMLELDYNQLTGTIPPELGNLTKLIELELNNNNLTGGIPDLSLLTDLQVLRLRDNQLTGSILEVSTLTSLTELSLQDNQLTGGIPDLSPLGSLTTLGLSNNSLCKYPSVAYGGWNAQIDGDGYTNCSFDCTIQGQIPRTQCEALVSLYDSTNGAGWSDAGTNNWLGNNTPCSWTGVTCSGGASGNVITIARVSSNLIGTIPNLSDLVSLLTLYLSGNQLTGTIPDLSVLTNLIELYLSSNQLTGTIPDLSALVNLTKLSFSDNPLTGSIPDLSALTNLQELYLYSNQLTGTIPDLSALVSLQELYLWNNQLTGNIPDLSTLTNLIELSLSRNQLTGTIPDLSALTSLDGLLLGYNQLSGTIPSLPASLTLADLGYNAFTGAIDGTANTEDPDWASTQTVPPTAGLNTTVLSNTSVKVDWTPITYQANGGYYEVKYSTTSGGPYSTSGGTIADKTVSTHTVTGLLAGTTYYFVVETYTPAHTWQQNNLTSIESAEVPATTTGSICNNPTSQTQIPEAECDVLVALYTSTNGASWSDSPGNNWLLTNTPCSWAGITCSSIPGNVTEIDRNTQNLVGTIPDLSALTSLTIFNVFNNQLTGNIPNLNTLTNLTTVRLENNQLTGSIPNLSTLINLQLLELDNNQLTGNIPNLSNLVDLQQLRLNNNQLTGIIPDLSTLINLQILRLDDNQLTGTIPTLPANITMADLSYNAFTGAIDGTANIEDPDWANTQTMPPTVGLGKTVLSDTSVKIDWTPITYQADGGYYQVKYSTTPGGPYSISINTTVDKIAGTLTVNGLLAGTTYYFVIETFTPAHGTQQNDITSLPSIEISATTTGSALSNLIATVVSDTQINLSWIDNSSNETGFKIERNGSLINTTAANATGYSDSGLTCGTTYNYSVRATNASDNSDAIITNATTLACPLEQPTVTHKLSIEKIGDGTITYDYGINCGSDCEHNFADQTEVSLIANPDTDWKFISWTGDCDKDGLVRINKDKTCIATFESTIQPVETPITDKPIVVPTDNKPIGVPVDNDIKVDAPTDTKDSTDISDSNELEIDGNGDGIQDNRQRYVITIPDAISGEYITIASHIGCPIKIASAHTEEDQAFENENYSFPQGIVYYEIQCSKVNLTIYFHGMSIFRKKPVYKKFGPLIPGDLSTLSWYTLPNVIFAIQTVNGKPVATAKFTLIDGELGDNTGVDGRIVDPGGIAFE